MLSYCANCYACWSLKKCFSKIGLRTIKMKYESKHWNTIPRTSGIRKLYFCLITCIPFWLYLIQEAIEKFDELINEIDRSHFKSAICVFMSHGKDDHIECSDTAHMDLRRCREKLGKSEALKRKPKIIITQACRGKSKSFMYEGKHDTSF